MAFETVKNTLDKLHNISPDAKSPTFILGDFNHCIMDKYLKGYYQYVTCATHGNKVLDRCYGPVPGAYMSLSLPPLGSSDHNISLLSSVYVPTVKQVKREV